MVCLSDVPGPQIPKFYAGRSVFITGASGFMGQVLVERLLTTCPDVEILYLLLRCKKNVAPDDRLKELKESQVFENLRQRQPSQLDKVRVVAGDITEPRLGLDQEAVQQLTNVSIVFHSAATLKFAEDLAPAIEQNLKSVLRVLDLCDSLPNLEALVHVSTAYSNAELGEVRELVYAAQAPIPAVLALADAAPPQVLLDITDKLIHPKPNTYCYTKALGEVAVKEHRGKYATAIFRPTIVVSSLRHPHPGWIQNLNGPSGVVASAGKGLLHVLRADSENIADLLPCDIGIDTLIGVGWETVVDKPSEVRVYNCSTGANPTTWRDFEREMRVNLRKYPMDNAYWYPSAIILKNDLMYRILEFLLHTMPLYFAEYMMKILGIKSKINLVIVSRRLQGMNAALSFFSMKEYKFETTNVQKLRQRLTPEDATIFNMDPMSIDWSEQYVNFVKGVRKYLFKEKDEDLPKARKHLQKMYYVHIATLAVFFFLLFRFAIQSIFINDVVRGTGRLLLALFNLI